MTVRFDPKLIETPCYVVDEKILRKNLTILQKVAKQARCKVLLAQKAFSMYYEYPLIRQYLNGTASSGLHEAMLGAEYMGGETHVFSAAYDPYEFDEIIKIGDHIVFNSFSQWERYREIASNSNKKFGIRINPAYSTQEGSLYNPCGKGSRLGVTKQQFQPQALQGLSGLHFHCLCQQNADALMMTLQAVEQQFGDFFPAFQWINFGGGHHITREDYDVEGLIDLIIRFRNQHHLDVYLEPGEAVALNAGFLVSTVLDVVHNDGDIAILDTSATCHMPDVLEMPYRPPVIGAGEPGEKQFTYRLAGPSCLAGDQIGCYSFDQPLQHGDRVVFGDMAIYTMVKNNTFNGIKLPAIMALDEQGQLKLVKKFGFEDFKHRL